MNDLLRRPMLLALLGGAFLMGPVAGVNAAAFVKYDGVDGESKDSNHDKWIDVLNIDWGASKPGGGATGQSRRRGSLVQELQLKVRIDGGTAEILRSVNSGKVFPTVMIDACEGPSSDPCAAQRQSNRLQHCYLKWELKNVMVTSYQVNASGDDRGTATLGMQFEDVGIEYTPSPLICPAE